jgi:hypothetical protein
LVRNKQCGKLQQIWTILENVDESFIWNIKQWYQLLEFIGHHISNLRNNYYKKKTCWDFFWECHVRHVNWVYNWEHTHTHTHTHTPRAPRNLFLGAWNASSITKFDHKLKGNNLTLLKCIMACILIWHSQLFQLGTHKKKISNQKIWLFN